MDSTHETAQKLSITEEKKTDVEFASQADSCSESSEQNVPQRRRRFPKVKPKPNLGSSPRSTQPRAQLKCLSKSSNQLCKDSSSNATSEQQQSVEQNSAKTQVESAETDSQHLTPSHSSLNIELSSANAGNAESEKSLGSTNEKDAQSDSIVMATSWVAESETMFTDSVSENKTNTRPPVEESTGGCISNQDKVETLDTEAASLCNTEQEINSRTAGSNTQPVGDPSTVSIVQHSHDVSALTTKAESIPENIQQSQSEIHSDIRSQDAAQHRSETNETKQANQDKCPPHESFSETQDVPADSSKTSRKPQTQRGRFIKPKPNLGRSSRPQRPQSKTENMTDSAVCSDNADASDSQKAVSELRSDVQVTLEAAKEQVGGLHVPPNDAGSTLGDLTQVHDSSAQSFQDATTSSTMETLNYQSLSIFQEILTEQVPSDPDEPFFVLSLTAIPVCPSGEVLDTVSEPYRPVTDVLAQQESSGPGETVTAGSDGSFANIHVPTSTEASNETDLISGKETGPDPAVSEQNLLMERPENPQDGSSAQPPNLPDATENTQESDNPLTKRRQTGRRAKLQVKPKTARNRQVRNKESLTVEEANKPLQTNTTQDAEIPRPSVQPEATDSTAKTWIEIISDSEEESGDRLVTEKSGKAVEDRSSGAQSKTAESRGKRQTRKSKNVLPVISETNSTKQPSDPPQAKASTRSKVKAPRAARRRTTPPAVASTSHDVAYSTVPEETHSPVSATPPSQIQMDVQQSEDHSQPLSDTAPSTSECTEVSSTQQSDWMESSQVDDEPTSVSQYFLSDIFTDVEDE
ncbi:uncharacterized protein LOC115429638 isoform X4 [Sphaeramia orbicularis]|uniref:uncharacterized protein LOC115429638 isoform X4 n=1 Tax=Sphaeramia orbicularis TaxID=375764 RepID=UPI00117CF637|nr:uncharacterized protein LOC115429638 isoform X4 [Sphaeramia orbicularis]